MGRLQELLKQAEARNAGSQPAVQDRPAATSTAPVSSTPQKSAGGGALRALVEKAKTRTPAAPAKDPYFYGTTEKGGAFGRSDQYDESGKPFFAFRNPGDTSTTTDRTRVATTFDYRKPQPVTRDDFYNPRALKDREELREAMGAGYSDELDHRIALALSGSNAKDNLKVLPGEENQEYGRLEQELQQKVIKGEISLLDAQLQMAKAKGFDVAWTPEENLPDEEPGMFEKTLSKVGSALKKAGAVAFKYGVEKPIRLFDRPDQSDMSTNATLNTLRHLPSSLVENIPFGYGTALKMIRDDQQTAAAATASDFAGAVVPAVVETGKAFAKAPIKAAASLYGTGAAAVTGDPSKVIVHWNIPGLGQVDSHAFDAYQRIVENGENPWGVILENNSNVILDTLMFTSILAKPFQARTTVTNKTVTPPSQLAELIARKKGSSANVPTTGAETLQIPTVQGPKSFRLYSPNTAYTNAQVISPQVKAAMEAQGVNFGKNFNPDLPVFFRLTQKPGGTYVGEVVQIKPSYFDTFVNKWRGDITKVPAENIQPVTDARTTTQAKLEAAAKKPAPGPIADVNTPPAPSRTPAQVMGLADMTTQAKAPALAALIETRRPQVSETQSNPLTEEARKYKSAEEFIGKSEQVFRGGDKAFDKTLIGEDGVFVSPSKFMAETFGKNVDELYITPNAKVLSYDALPQAIRDIDNWDDYSVAVSKYGREKGVDVIDSLPAKADFPRGMERTVLNPDVIQTKSQLTNLYNQAHQAPKSKTYKKYEEVTPFEKRVEEISARRAAGEQSPALPNRPDIWGEDDFALVDMVTGKDADIAMMADMPAPKPRGPEHVNFLKEWAKNAPPPEKGMTKAQAEIVAKLIEDIGETLFDDIGVIFEVKGGGQALYNYGTGVIKVFTRNVQQSGSNFDRAIIHELWHSLARYLPEKDLRAVRGDFERAVASYAAKNPWFVPFRDRGLMNRRQYEAFIEEYGRYAIQIQNNTHVSTDSRGRTRYSIQYTPENYRLKNIDEWFAENLTDTTFKNFKGYRKETRGIFAHLKRIFKGFLRAIMRLFGKDTAGRIYEDFTTGKNRSQVRKTNLGKPGDEHELFGFGKGKGNKPKKTELPDDAPKKKPVSLNEKFFDTVKRTLDPLSGLDKPTADLFHRWNQAKLLGNEVARANADFVRKHVPDGMAVIHEYEAGSTEFPAINIMFNAMHEEANARGLDVKFRENYVPHVYADNPAAIRQAAIRKLESLGMEKADAEAYVDQERILKPSEANRMKLTPAFSKQRIFETYAEAQKFGLKPKYDSVADLAGHYRVEMERAIANRELMDNLKASKKILPEVNAPRAWPLLSPNFSAFETFKAPVPVARVINSIFKDQSIPELLPTVSSAVAKISRFWQEMMLSAGVPVSNVNFFSIGQMIKEITAGNFKAVSAFVRANSNDRSVKWMNTKKHVIQMMGAEGIDLSQRLGQWGERSFRSFAKSREIRKALKVAFDEAFNKKTFASFMPQLYIGLFDDVYQAGIKAGMPQAKAQQLAGDTVKNNFGMFDGKFARAEVVEDVMSTFLFAPKFREGIVRTLARTGYAGYDWAKSKKTGTTPDPALARNRRLIVGMAITYVLYNLINAALNDGDYMWENPNGREFAIRIPKEDGTVLYVEMMPGFLAFPRAMATGALALAKADTETALQKFGTLASAPVKFLTEAITNEDYFGREIYKEYDSMGTKLAKVAAHFGLSISHPYIKQLSQYLTGDIPLDQAVISALEIPVKFSSLDKESKSRFYDAIREQQAEAARARDKFMPTFEKIQKLFDERKDYEANQIINSLTEDERAIYKTLARAAKTAKKKAAKEDGFKQYEAVMRHIENGRQSEAEEYIDNMTQEEYDNYIRVRDSLRE